MYNTTLVGNLDALGVGLVSVSGVEIAFRCPLGMYAPRTSTLGDNLPDAGCPFLCAPGHYGNGTEQTCSGLCNAGGWCGPGSTSISGSPCPENTYQPVQGATDIQSCIQCPDSRCVCCLSFAVCCCCSLLTLCDHLSFLSSSSTTNGLTGATSVDNCTCDTTTVKVSAALGGACLLCDVGETLDRSLLTVADGGGEVYGAASCSPCAAGTYKETRGGGACTACPVNTWLDGEGATQASDCQPCPPNSNSNLTAGLGDERDCVCSDSFFRPTDANGYGECMRCVRGEYLVVAAGDASNMTGTCEACPRGTFKTDEGNQECTQCGRGSWNAHTGSTSENDCVACDPVPGRATTAGAGSSSLSDCICAEGFCTAESGSAESFACVECSDAMNCSVPGTAQNDVQANEGFWRGEVDSTFPSSIFYECPISGSCRGSSALSTSSSSSSRRRRGLSSPPPFENLCSEGHSGPLCAACSENYTLAGDSCFQVRGVYSSPFYLTSSM